MTDKAQQESPASVNSSPVSSSSHPETIPNPGLLDAARSIHLQDFKHLHETPCVRPAFLYGISSGFVLAGLQLVLGASIRKATSWALGSFMGVSVVVYEGCHFRREREKERIKLIQEAMERKAREKAKEQFRQERMLRQMAAEAREKEEQVKKERSRWFWQ